MTCLNWNRQAGAGWNGTGRNETDWTSVMMGLILFNGQGRTGQCNIACIPVTRNKLALLLCALLQSTHGLSSLMQQIHMCIRCSVSQTLVSPYWRISIIQTRPWINLSKLDPPFSQVHSGNSDRFSMKAQLSRVENWSRHGLWKIQASKLRVL